MVNTLEIACLSSAFALAYLVYKVSGGQSTLPVEVDGEMVFVPKTLIDIMSDLSEFSLNYNNTMSRIHDGPRLPEDEYALVVQADRKCQACVTFAISIGFRGTDMTYSIRDGFNALYDRVTAICARGGEVEDDLLAYREQQKVEIHEIQVSWSSLYAHSLLDLNGCTRNSWGIIRQSPELLVEQPGSDLLQFRCFATHSLRFLY